MAPVLGLWRETAMLKIEGAWYFGDNIDETDVLAGANLGFEPAFITGQIDEATQ